MGKKKRQHGGPRPGSGRKPKHNEPTKIKTVSVPVSLIEWAEKQPGRNFSDVVIDSMELAREQGLPDK